MTLRHLTRGISLIPMLLLAQTATASAPTAGGLLGFVEDTRGLPVAGAVVSLFGKGLGGSGLVTLSDSTGRFFLPSLPAGAYTVRTLGAGHQPAPARQVVVFPDQDSLFTVSLTPLLDAAVAAAAAVRPAPTTQKEKDDAKRELQWLLRHKRRSVLEARENGQPAEPEESTRLATGWVPDLDGTLELLTTPAGMGAEASPWGPAEAPTSFSLVRLQGKIANSGEWTLGGLVSENESASWRMAGEFVFAPGSGHELQAAIGYGTRYLRSPVATGVQSLQDRSVGALSLQDRWDIDDRVTATVAGRFSYAGFIRDTNEFDPSGALELRYDDRTTVRALAGQRTVVPGGDVLTLSGVSTGPALVFGVMDDRLRPERVTRYELQLDQALGRTQVVAHTFYEGVRDQVLNGYSGPNRPLTVSNAGNLSTRGMGLSVGRRFGGGVRGTMSYTFGHSWRDEQSAVPSPALAFREADFHDLAARVETVIEGTDTRVVAFYRLNRIMPDETATSSLNTRFDVQLSQGLPFIGGLTRADWNVLLAVRNLFYETSEGALLDEIAVANPPKRVLGGISVRF